MQETWNLSYHSATKAMPQILSRATCRAEYRLFDKALLQQRPVIFRSLLIIDARHDLWGGFD